MNKLSLAIAVIASLAAPLVRAQQPTATWVVVDNFSLVNQTQPIATPIAIYAPTMAGLYRISYYVEAVATTLTTYPEGDSVCVTMNYTDDSGQVQQRTPPDYICAGAQIQQNGATTLYGSSDVFVFRSKATPITLTVPNSERGTLTITYSLTGTIERLTTSN